MEEIAIKVERVSKNFKLPHEKVNSLKSLVVNPFKKHKTYEIQHALKDISFEVKKGEFFGIVGRNGSGKSTLLKILAGIYLPTKGSVQTFGKLVPFIELGVGFNPELTGRENVYLNGALLGFNNQQIKAMYDDIVSFAELEKFMDQKLKNYSSGMQVRLAFSMAIRAEGDILLVDEVLAVGDADFQRKCFEYFRKLKRDKKTVVFVSHDMDAIKQYCDQVIMIEQSEIIESGSALKIALRYTKMFIDQANLRSNEENKYGAGSKHVGNGDVKISNVSVVSKEDKLLITIEAEVHKPVAKLIYGLHVLAGDGKEVTAMNNRMINQPDVEDLKPGSKLTISWEVLNIFNDGRYSITLTLIDEVSNTLDWFTDAASFMVNRAERSTTAVLPPMKVSHKINQE